MVSVWPPPDMLSEPLTRSVPDVPPPTTSDPPPVSVRTTPDEPGELPHTAFTPLGTVTVCPIETVSPSTGPTPPGQGALLPVPSQFPFPPDVISAKVSPPSRAGRAPS